jgi:predicted SnoaL-like aldol condensation-catalyzing enzyme
MDALKKTHGKLWDYHERSTGKNKEVVREFCNLVLNLRKPQEGIAKYRGSSYRKHNPTAGDGRHPL